MSTVTGVRLQPQVSEMPITELGIMNPTISELSYGDLIGLLLSRSDDSYAALREKERLGGYSDVEESIISCREGKISGNQVISEMQTCLTMNTVGDDAETRNGTVRYIEHILDYCSNKSELEITQFFRTIS